MAIPEERLNELRVDQTRRELKRLRGEVRAWLDRRRRSDESKQRPQHTTHFAVLDEQLNGMLDGIEGKLGEIPTTPTRWQTYAECRKQEERLLWVRRLWTYFQTKLDQRDDKELGTLLSAADEVIWSCYCDAFSRTKRPLMPVPLAFVASFYSPLAVPRDEPPQDLRSDVDAAFLNEMLREMPIPVVALPPNCRDEPWRLAYLAHEVGHHVQADLDLVGTIGDVLEAEAGERWRYWGQEIFADLFSLLALGPWALWALGEIAWTSAKSMLDASPRYPSPLVRLLLMKTMADKLGLDGNAGLRGITAHQFELTAQVREDLQQIDKVADALLATLPTIGSLADLLTFDAGEFGQSGTTALWAETLAGRKQMIPLRQIQCARMVLSGGVRCYAESTTLADAQRTALTQRLKATLCKTIVDSGEESVRSAPLPAGVDLKKRTERLTQLLFAGG